MTDSMSASSLGVEAPNVETTGDEAGDSLPDRPWVHALVVLVGLLTFALVAIGGNVTSLGAGLAFPEGWTTAGYWSLLAPL